MPIVNKEQLKKYKEAGWELVAPGQGIWPVPDGLAAVANIDLAEYPGAQFVQLAYEGRCSPFILYPVDAVEFAKEWIDELLDYTFFKLHLSIDCYEVRFDEHNLHASTLVRPFAANLDFIAQIIEEIGGTTSFDQNRQDGLIEVNYQTKCTSLNRQEHTDEIASFEELVIKLLEASSFVNGFGFAIVARDIIDCKSMWTYGITRRRLDFERVHVEPVFNKLRDETKGYTAIQRLAEFNAITSHRAQIIFGYEAVVALLQDSIEQHKEDAFRLTPSDKKKFKRELRSWIRQWAESNEVNLSIERLDSLELSPHSILNDGYMSTNKDIVLAAFSDCLKDNDLDREHLELLYNARNAYAHNRRDEYTVEQLTSILGVLRKLLTTIASM